MRVARELRASLRCMRFAYLPFYGYPSCTDTREPYLRIMMVMTTMKMMAIRDSRGDGREVAMMLGKEAIGAICVVLLRLVLLVLKHYCY